MRVLRCRSGRRRALLLQLGSPVAPACSACGNELLDGARFCSSCGTPVAGQAAGPSAGTPTAAAAPTSERRVTSVLFGDLVAFTTLSESLDPEEVRELLGRYFDTARGVVARYGGTIEKFIGDAVMAVWGVPTAHEDDAERAVRAGLDLVEAVAAFGESVGAPGLAMRVGVVTGEVAVTLGATGQGMVAGDAVNTAARVQAKAAPGSVWVDGQTRRWPAPRSTSPSLEHTSSRARPSRSTCTPRRPFAGSSAASAAATASKRPWSGAGASSVC